MKTIYLSNQYIWLSEHGYAEINVVIPVKELKSDCVVEHLIPWSDTISGKERMDKKVLCDCIYNKDDHIRVIYYQVSNYFLEIAEAGEDEEELNKIIKPEFSVERESWEINKWYYHHKSKTYRNIMGSINETSKSI